MPPDPLATMCLPCSLHALDIDPDACVPLALDTDPDACVPLALDTDPDACVPQAPPPPNQKIFLHL